MKRARVLVAGDAHCGKTALISALHDEQSAEALPAVHPPVHLGEASLPGSRCTIVDSSSHPQDVAALETEIRQADVICLVYSAENSESYTHISSYWIPLVRRVLDSDGDINTRPIIVACNKIDRRPGPVQRGPAANMQSLMKNFQEIDTCIECSATTDFNVKELFYFAQRAVVFPRAVLYNTHEHALTAAATRALGRIFRLCDVDNDGVLNDNELQKFQIRCFNAPLSQEELRGVKEVVRHSTDHGVTAAGITCEGFFYLHRNFIERGILETTWIALRRFGYTDTLDLRDELARPPLPAVGHCELSAAGLDFLKNLFSRYDPDDSGVLLPPLLAQLWTDCPRDPWQDLLLPNNAGVLPPLTCSTFLALWRVMIADDTADSLYLLALLGFGLDDGPNATAATAITVLKPNQHSRRTVFRACILGAPLCGKSSLIRSLAEHGLLLGSSTGLVRAVLVAPTSRGPVTITIGEPEASSSIDSRAWDAVVLGFDQHDPSSFGQVASFGERLPSRVGCVVVACKSDLLTIPQDYLISPADFCAARGLRPPLSSADPVTIIDAVAEACVTPQAAPLGLRTSLLTKVLGATAFIAALIAMFFAVRRANRR